MTNTAQTTTPAVKLGDIFVCSWGYDQTNVDFYKVVGVTAKSVKIQKWTQTADENGRVVAGDKPSTVTDWSGVDQAADYWTQQEQKVERDAPIQLKRVQNYGDRPFLSMTSYSNAYLWDGAPEYQTPAGGGH